MKRTHRKKIKYVQQILSKKKTIHYHANKINPFQTGNPLFSKPPKVIRPSNNMLPSSSEEPTPSFEERCERSDRLLSFLGDQALIGTRDQGIQEFWISLKPKILGGMQIQIRQKQSNITATMIAPSVVIENLLNSKKKMLQELLEKKGLRVSKIEVILDKRKEQT